MDRDAFYDKIRSSCFAGHIFADQMHGLEALLDAGSEAALPLPQLAYVLATAYHETARTMQPLEEYGRGRGRDYGRPDPETGQIYYGRGYCQLTWKENYKKMAERLSLPELVEQPDLALDRIIAGKIIITGMREGLFTGKTLDRYLTPENSDYFNARRIVNWLDCATMIAGYAEDFEAALVKAGYAPTPQPAEAAAG